MTTPTAADFAAARFAEHPDGRFAARIDTEYSRPWAAQRGDPFVWLSDQAMAEQGWRIVTPALDPFDPDVVEQAAQRAYGKHNSNLGVEWFREDERVQESWRTIARAALSALTPPPARPAWLDAPAVLAWHKNDGRTERTGRPGVKRVWSPDYRQTETWSTPSLRNVHWSDLRDVEPLGVGGGEG